MTIAKRFKPIIIIILILAVLLVGTDVFIKCSFGSMYHKVSYRLPSTDFNNFFKAIECDDSMTIEMMNLYFGNENNVIALDMNFSKVKSGSEWHRYKSSYNLQGSRFPGLYYTGRFSEYTIDEPYKTEIKKYTEATPKVLQALSSFPAESFYKSFPKANMYNLTLKYILPVDLNGSGFSELNRYIWENGSIHKITGEDNMHGNYAIFGLEFIDKLLNTEQKINHILNSNPNEDYLLYISID